MLWTIYDRNCPSVHGKDKYFTINFHNNPGRAPNVTGWFRNLLWKTDTYLGSYTDLYYTHKDTPLVTPIASASTLKSQCLLLSLPRVGCYNSPTGFHNYALAFSPNWQHVPSSGVLASDWLSCTLQHLRIICSSRLWRPVMCVASCETLQSIMYTLRGAIYTAQNI